MSRIVIPTSTDWLQSADFSSGTVLVEGRLAEIVHPELWRGSAAAWSRSLDARAWDASGTGNHATHSGNLLPTPEAWKCFGVAGGAHFNVADNPTLDLGTSVLFSASAWVKFDTDATTQALFGKGNQLVTAHLSCIYHATINALRITLANETPLFAVYDGTTDVAATGKWHHLAFVLRSRNATAGEEDGEVYVDAVAEGSRNGSLTSTGTNINLNNDLPLTIGIRQTSSVQGDHFRGEITDMMFHRRGLSVREVQILAERRGIAYECRLLPKVFAF